MQYSAVFEDGESVWTSIENFLLTPEKGAYDVKIDSKLTKNQSNKLTQIPQLYFYALADASGKTKIIECKLLLNYDIPVRRKTYMLTFALRDKVKIEINNMVEAGIVQKSTSPYASPISVLPWKDGLIQTNSFIYSNDRILQKSFYA